MSVLWPSDDAPIIPIRSPYSADWNFGPLPKPGLGVDATLHPAARRIVVIVPGIFVGLVRDPAGLDGRFLWVGWDDECRVACDGANWCRTVDGESWSSWQETNVWWVEV